jgi:hypothetical protein
MVDPSSIFCELTHRIQERTGWRLRNLVIEIQTEPERAVLRGHATTSMARQIAENLVHDHFPHAAVENAIAVDNAVEIIPGMPLN